MDSDSPDRVCPGCHATYRPRRRDQTSCGRPACRKRVSRGAVVEPAYEVTAEDRAAIRRVIERDGCGHPRAHPVTPEEHAAHLERIAARRASRPDSVNDSEE